MPVPFGFSVGDFIAVVGIFKDVGTALRATGGASDDYLHIAQELESIAAVLQTLQNTPDITEGTTYVNAIRDQAQASHQLLLKFLQRIKKYEASLGLGTHRGFRHGVASAKWALMVSKDLTSLRQEINASTLSLRLLQNLHNMNLITSIIRQGETIQQEVSKRIGQTEGLERIVTSVSCTLDTRHQQILDLMHKIEMRNEAQHHSLFDKINEIKVANTQSINHSTSFNFNQNLTENITQPNTLNLRRTSCLGLKLLVRGIRADFLKLFSSMIGFFRKLFMLSPQILVFLYILHNLPAQIGNFLSDDIHLDDALGEGHRLQYQYFRSWEVLKTMLTVQFRGKPGEAKVAMGNFRILNARFQDIILDENNWSTDIKPGMRLIMSIEITKLRKPPKQGRCIRTGCLGVMNKLPRSAKISCPICGFDYFPGFRAPIIKIPNSSERSVKQKDFVAEVEETRRMLERMKAKATRMETINPSGVRRNKRDEILKDLETISLEAEEQELENIRLQRRHRYRQQQQQQQHIT